MVRPGMVAVDIGANAGDVTASLLEAVAPAGAVYAIEPHEALQANLARMGARTIRAAVLDVDGPVTLYHSKETPHASLYPANVRDPIDEVEVVRGVTLDSLQGTGELPLRLDVIKVDAQGAEAAILRGASQVLQRREAVWYMELWSLGLAQAGDSVEIVRELFEAAGYEPHGRDWPTVVEMANREKHHSAIDVVIQPKGTTHGMA